MAERVGGRLRAHFQCICGGRLQELDGHLSSPHFSRSAGALQHLPSLSRRFSLEDSLNPFGRFPNANL